MCIRDSAYYEVKIHDFYVESGEYVISVGSSSRAVSYTHLDVYKRQVMVSLSDGQLVIAHEGILWKWLTGDGSINLAGYELSLIHS